MLPSLPLPVVAGPPDGTGTLGVAEVSAGIVGVVGWVSVAAVAGAVVVVDVVVVVVDVVVVVVVGSVVVVVDVVVVDGRGPKTEQREFWMASFCFITS